MTSLFVTIVAIVLFGIVALLSITYIDVDNAKAATQAPVVVAAMGNMVEAVSIYRQANDAAPVDVSQLSTVVATPALPNIPGATWNINSGRACLALPTTSANTDLLNAAAVRVSTSGGPSTVSSVCGGITLSGMTALSVPV